MKAAAEPDRAELVWTEDRIRAAGTDAWLFEAVRSLLQASAGEALFLLGTVPLCARRPAVTRLVFPLALLAAVKALRRAAVRIAAYALHPRAPRLTRWRRARRTHICPLRAGRRCRRASTRRSRAAVL